MLIMKKLFVALMLLSCIFLTSCSDENVQSSYSEYPNEYSAIFEKIKAMNSDSEYMVGVYEECWSRRIIDVKSYAGNISLIYASPYDSLYGFMDDFDYVKMCTPPKSEEDRYITGIDLYNSETRARIARAICPEALNEDETDIISGTEDMVNAACGKYQEKLESIPNANSEIKEAIKALRVNYPDNSADTDKLHSYYVESSYLAEFAPEPIVNELDEYRSKYNEMIEKINTAEKHADLF